MKKTKKETEEKAEERVNNPVARWRRGNKEITKWHNIDDKTGNEWFNFLIKVGRKDRESGEWINDQQIRLSEGEFDNFRIFISVISDENMRLRIEKK